MSEPTKAVFLSYAREDTDAARRIADALRAFGVEVWFDQSELRGGDAWDQKIRKQINDCTLFLPIISRHTQERGKGYFRLEWKLAVEQTHLMLEGVPFLAPVVIDDTPDSGAAVPPEFMRVQWTRLTGALPTTQFVEQVKRLLDAPQNVAQASSRQSGMGVPPMNHGQDARATPTVGRRVPAAAWVAAIAAFAAAGGVFWWRQTSSPPNAGAGTRPPTSERPAVSQVDAKSIAVLPFENLSTDPENAFFASGVHEDVLTNLQKIRSFRVISRTSVLRYRERPDNLRQIARELGVNYIVEGSVRRAEGRVLVTAQLIDARTDQHLWADNFEAELKDVFAIQGRIAEQIATQLRTQLSPEERASIAAAPTTSVEAYKLYQQGRDVLQGTGTYGLRSGRNRRAEAIALLNSAVELDPKFHRAWVELVEAHSLAASTADGPAREAAMREADAALAQAQAIAPRDPWTHYAQAMYHYNTNERYDAALAALAPAQAARPNEPEFVRLESRIVRRQGDIARAMATNFAALQLDPHSVPLWRERWENMHFTRRHAEGAAIAARMITLEPNQANWRYRKVTDEFLATAAPAAVEELARFVSTVDLATVQGTSYGETGSPQFELWEWRDDRANLLKQAGEVSPASNLGNAWITLLALQSLGEGERSRALAAAMLREAESALNSAAVEIHEGLVVNLSPLLYLAGAHAVLGHGAEAAQLVARYKSYLPRQSDARSVMTMHSGLIKALQLIDRDEAAVRFLERLDAPMNPLSLDRVAAYHWEYRALLTHPRVKALLVKQGKWLPYLAERVPEYAEFKTAKK